MRTMIRSTIFRNCLKARWTRPWPVVLTLINSLKCSCLSGQTLSFTVFISLLWAKKKGVNHCSKGVTSATKPESPTATFTWHESTVSKTEWMHIMTISIALKVGCMRTNFVVFITNSSRLFAGQNATEALTIQTCCWQRSCMDASRWQQVAVQALVYDILPSTTAVFSYVIGSRKLSANEQFFC